MLSKKKDMELLVGKVMETLAEHVENHVPEIGPIRKGIVRFAFPNSPFTGMLIVEQSYHSEHGRRITAGVVRDKDDRMVSNYLFPGTMAEVLTWLKNKDNLPGLIDTFMHLKDHAKDLD